MLFYFLLLLLFCCISVTPALRCEHDWCMDTERSASLQSWSSSSSSSSSSSFPFGDFCSHSSGQFWKGTPAVTINLVLLIKNSYVIYTHTSPPRVECPNPSATSVSWINHCCLIRSGAPRLLSDPCSAAVWTPPTTLYVYLPLTLTQ